MDLEGHPTGAAPLFPGFLETEFSTPNRRYFYKDCKEESESGAGCFADVFEYVTPASEGGGCALCRPLLFDIV